MGFLNFLKKKGDTAVKSSLDLPPIPSMPASFPEPGNVEVKQMDETGLPPLPNELPEIPAIETHPKAPQDNEGQVPVQPQLSQPIEIPKIPEQIQPLQQPASEEAGVIAPMDMPTAPITMAGTQGVMQEVNNEKVKFPEKPHEAEFVPDKIPPLENLPPPPKVRVKEEESVELNMPTDNTYKKQKMKLKDYIFVKVDAFKSIIDNIEEIKIKFKEEDEVFTKVLDCKNSQDHKFEVFRELLEDIQRKLIFIDKTVYENAH